MILTIIHWLFIISITAFLIVMYIQKPLTWKYNQKLIKQLNVVGHILIYIFIATLTVIIINSFYQQLIN